MFYFLTPRKVNFQGTQQKLRIVYKCIRTKNRTWFPLDCMLKRSHTINVNNMDMVYESILPDSWCVDIVTDLELSILSLLVHLDICTRPNQQKETTSLSPSETSIGLSLSLSSLPLAPSISFIVVSVTQELLFLPKRECLACRALAVFVGYKGTILLPWNNPFFFLFWPPRTVNLR